MRFAFLLLVAAASLIASSDALSTQADATSRHLRSHHKKNAYNAEEEERTLDKSIVKALPDQFKKMYKYPSNMENVLESWRTGFQSVDDAVMHMKSLNMDFDAISHFVAAYRAHIQKYGRPY
ncbi:hypothetical protein P3T76_009619 [Phytophthora citrophthora]|uniref:RxLR effector protein n=1 Tax=Phytophthora citrophthora TaxID=4793 RepID=A0AAD9LJH8_9STRA|nr:hypothetical protein P3T76_009619 [Phytophthora citrophthora]